MLRILILSFLSFSCHTVSVVGKKHANGGELLIEPSLLGDWQVDSENVMSRTCRYKGYKSKQKYIKDGKILIKFECLKKK
jgi:hypothetical protein